MKKETTLQELNGILMELQTFLANDFPTVKILAGEKIKRFYNRNEQTCNMLNGKTIALMDLYVEKNELEDFATKGKYKFAKTVTEVGEIMQPVFIDADCEDKYKAAWDVLMKTKCTIVI